MLMKTGNGYCGRANIPKEFVQGLEMMNNASKSGDDPFDETGIQ